MHGTCINETQLPTTAVSAMTRPVPWSSNIPSPILAAADLAIKNVKRTN